MGFIPLISRLNHVNQIKNFHSHEDKQIQFSLDGITIWQQT